MDVLNTTNATNNATLSLPPNNEPPQDPMYIVVPIIIIYIIIFLTGTIGNVSTCVVIAKNKIMHTATNYYLFSLAISDLLLLITGVPEEIYLIWTRHAYVFGKTYRFVRGLCAETSANATVLTITAFTVERYLAICHPFLSHTLSKLSRAVKLIFAIWFVACMFAMPQAIQLAHAGAEDEDECEVCLLMAPLMDYSFQISTFVFFVAPMTLITVLYILIGLRLKSSKMMKRKQSQGGRKIIKMLVAVVIAFFLCWAPFHIQRLFTLYSTNSSIGPHSWKYQMYVIMTYISGVLYYVSATINPILYNIMSVKFREAFKETFARCLGLNTQYGRPQRSYSVLSKSAVRGPDSNESTSRQEASVHPTQTSVTQKTSIESFNGVHYHHHGSNGDKVQIQQSRRPKSSTFVTHNQINIEEEETAAGPGDPKCPNNNSPTYIRIHVKPVKRLSKFWKICECVTKKRLDKKRSDAYYLSPVKEPEITLELDGVALKKEPWGGRPKSPDSCDISNSSLNEVEMFTFEDELTAYMREIAKRECGN